MERQLESFRLVDSGWAEEIDREMKSRPAALRIICPFIKQSTVQRFLKLAVPPTIEVITRFDLNGFNAGVSDLAALETLLRAGATVRGIRGLHSKMYVFGTSSAIVTSANLTEAAMFRNKEFGFCASDSNIVSHCLDYFADLWGRTSVDLDAARLAQWAKTLAGVRLTAAPAPLPDFGEDVDLASPFLSASPLDAPLQSFVKFFGRSEDRADLSMDIGQEVARSGSNWACTYPTGKRPRQVQDGAVMFMARMVQDRSDYRIYGRAIGRQHVPGTDDATPGDLSARSWKADWSHYIRVHSPVFIDGPLSTGVSMVDMMDELGALAFAPTLRNLSAGFGNTSPRRAIMRKPSVQLTPQAHAWISTRLEAALLKHGTLDLSGAAFDGPHP
ncbi:phospholipase D family protein [Devosia sp.]|uniref:phospholipase D family protein n=1 Tax=Devosia sp. TaxID=1871048 RepID=UPI001A00E0C4|nr:phospholipase D family protein [Devosia sp.]MBE0581265.1 phospholipase D family protein [Devosia sp.]